MIPRFTSLLAALGIFLLAWAPLSFVVMFSGVFQFPKSNLVFFVVGGHISAIYQYGPNIAKSPRDPTEFSVEIQNPFKALGMKRIGGWWPKIFVPEYAGEPKFKSRLYVPLWLLGFLACFPVLFLRFRRWLVYQPPGHCPYCGYDLRATPDRCPECGKVLEQAVKSHS